MSDCCSQSSGRRTNTLHFSELCQYSVSEKKFPKVVKWLDRVREASKDHYEEAYEFINKKSKQAAEQAKQAVDQAKPVTAKAKL